MPSTPSKLCVVGAPGAGKTQLIRRLLHGDFEPVPVTPGITVQAATLPAHDAEPFAVTLWDVAANSAIDCLNQAFLSRVDGVAAVVASTDPLEVERALRLVAEVRRLHPGCAAVLMRTKCDIATSDDALTARPGGVPAYTVSARDGRGVVEAFTALARAAREQRAAATLEPRRPHRAQ